VVKIFLRNIIYHNYYNIETVFLKHNLKKIGLVRKKIGLREEFNDLDEKKNFLRKN